MCVTYVWTEPQAEGARQESVVISVRKVLKASFVWSKWLFWCSGKLIPRLNVTCTKGTNQAALWADDPWPFSGVAQLFDPP